MEVYSTIADWSGWPVIVALLLLAGATMNWAWNHRVETLKEKNDWLETQLNERRNYSPDILAQRLSDRLKMQSEELERLHSDSEINQELIKQKERELRTTKQSIAELQSQLMVARNFLQENGLACPICGSPLESVELVMEPIIYQGRDMDIEHEIARYSCGYEITEGQVIAECGRGL